MSDPEFLDSPNEPAEFESIPTSSEEVESAGRSCLAILILAVLILILVCVWIGFWSTADG